MKTILVLSLTTSRHILLVQLISKYIFTNYEKTSFFFNLYQYLHFVYMRVVIERMFKLYFLISIFFLYTI
jgi:hypothetical protein